eukprot:c14611_g1_i1.p1 GENE.c14611_g1_i1~~c14611_g1_i1.p1  ORF type:complete len:476 (-),score=109.41 c14611_g1_i1:80-1471(-)
MTRLFWGVLFCHWVHASITVISPTSLHINARSPFSSEVIGVLDHNFNITAEAAFVVYLDCASGLVPETTSVDSKVVLIRNTRNLQETLVDLEREVVCLESAGAAAVVWVSTLSALVEPGVGFYWNDRRLKHNARIPLLEVTFREVKALLVALNAGTNVTVIANPSTNRWQEILFDSAAFVVIMRAFMVVINFVGILIALEGLVSHIHRVAFDTRALLHDSRSMVWVMILGTSLEIVACTVRVVYCAIGPLFSTSRIYYVDHMCVLFTAIGLDVLTTLVAVCLFLRWGAFGLANNCLKKHLEKVLAVIGATCFLAAIVFAYVLGSFETANIAAGVSMVAIVTIVLLSMSGLAFVIAGIRFVRQLHLAVAENSTNHARNKSMQKAVRWIIASGCFNLLEVIGTVFVVTPIFAYPRGYFVIGVFIYYGMSLSGLSHALAFRPIAESRWDATSKFVQILIRMTHVVT